MEIQEALAQLDPAHAGHWTNDGKPRVDVMSGMVGRQITRVDIENADPGFDRAIARERMEKSDEPTEDQVRKVTHSRHYGRVWLYHSSCPEGQIFEGPAAADALEQGWCDNPSLTKEPAPE